MQLTAGAAALGQFQGSVYFWQFHWLVGWYYSYYAARQERNCRRNFWKNEHWTSRTDLRPIHILWFVPNLVWKDLRYGYDTSLLKIKRYSYLLLEYLFKSIFSPTLHLIMFPLSTTHPTILACIHPPSNAPIGEKLGDSPNPFFSAAI